MWSLYSTRAVAHTIDTYSKFSFPYPYPNAVSVNTWASGGMEYPMISFNGYRPVKDEKTGVKTYTRNAKYGLIGVVIHEVGHNYFPMVVNSDERQWTWMDEGLNSFLEAQSELLWEEEFPAGAPGAPNVLDSITSYMTSEDQVPVMTNSESVKQFGPNAYSKPTAALTVLRETVMGRELFDFAFKEYAKRWRFKRPTPADFFRTLEDASGVDLDWFWRGWFYTTDHVDVALTSVREYRISSRDPNVEAPLRRERDAATPEAPTVTGNKAQGLQTYVQKHPDAKDFYNENDAFAVNNKDLNDYTAFQEGLKEPEKSVFERALRENPYIYFMDFSNIGGLVSPLPLKFTYEDGSVKEQVIPAEIWRMNNEKVTKFFVEPKKVVSVELDARHQIADADPANNAFPQKVTPSRLELFRANQAAARNQMADALVELKAKEAPASPAAPISPGRPQ